MTSHVDVPMADGVPVRQVADLILSFGLDLPAIPGPGRAAGPDDRRRQRRAPRSTAPHVPAPRDGSDGPRSRARHQLREDRPPAAGHLSTGHTSSGQSATGRPSGGRHGLREDPVRDERPVDRTVAVSPEILARARRMAFDPSHPSARTTRARVTRPSVPAPRPAADEMWAPTPPRPARDSRAEPELTTAVRAASRARPRDRHADAGFAPDRPDATALVPAYDPGAEPTTIRPLGPPTELIGEVTRIVSGAALAHETAVRESAADETAVREITAPAPLALRSRARTARPLLLATASMASVAVVGAAAAAAMSLTGGSVAPTANTAAADLDARLAAAKPPTAPTTASEAHAGAATTTAGHGAGEAPTSRQDTTSAPITSVTDGYRDATRTVAKALPAAMRQSGAERVATQARGAAAPAVTGSGTAAGAVKVALAQIGTPYRWGGASTSGFDCSGLVVYAFKQLGISLPHSSSALSKMGTAVSKANLRPGDLVFYYTPVSHVAIYIGDGKVVNATTEGEPVQISDLDDFPMHSARRI
ncbi:NlpC/P60 family protein [Pseudonocardia benzenivorans]|uniref:NlpC/P60 family protein n=1 Tax=Pseudonocardia benzenivorans TaxID=228005 RepID=A0ABW3VES2_9PSEU